MSTDVPLLNDYKKAFVRRRFLQTLLAGLRIPSVPWYAVLIQLVIFALPLSAIVPYLLIFASYNVYSTSVIFASVISLLALITQTFAKLFAWLSTKRADNEVVNYNQEDEIEESVAKLYGMCSVKTWSFLLPAKRHWWNVPLHSAIAGLLAFSASHYLLPNSIDATLGGLIPHIVILVFAWLSFLQSYHALVVITPPETSTFRAQDNYEVDSMSRAFHVIILTIPHWMSLLKNESVISASETAENLDYLLYYGRLAGYILVMLLPLLWVLGVLPPFEPLFLWLIEQTQIFLFGGTPSASLLRSFCQISFSIAHYLIVVIFISDKWSIVVVSGLTGYILSLDWIGLADHLIRGHTKTEPDSYNFKTIVQPKGKNILVSQSRKFIIAKECLTHLFFYGMNTVVILALAPQKLAYRESHQTNSTIHGESPITEKPSELVTFLGWTVVICYICFKLTNELQKVFLLYGLFRSPIYHGCSTNELVVLLWHHLRAFLVNFITCLLMTFYVKALLAEDYQDWSTFSWWWKAIEVLAIIRAFRWIWQNNESSLIELSLFHLYIIFVKPQFELNLSHPVQLLMICFMRDRLKQMVEKSFLVCSLAVSSLEDRASKRSYAGCLFQINLICSPIILCVIIGSAILSAPIMTAFTLPIFFLAYPRPLKFWPQGQGDVHHEAEKGDSVYYKQMVPQLLRGIHKAIRAGRLGLQQPGNHLLARHEDRTVWIQILEKGNGYLYYQAKGLELQETSCHSLEVTRIDDIFQDTFEREAKLNHFSFHTLTPLVSLPVVMYASSKNVLTGIIESHDTLALIGKLYTHTLVWYTLRAMIFEEKSAKEVPLPEDSHDSDELTQYSQGEPVSALPQNITYLSVEHELHPSSSIEAVNLDSWPSSETSPDQELVRSVKLSGVTRKSAYFLKQGSSEESLPSILASDHEFDTPVIPIKRKGLLPPIKTEPNLPGGLTSSDESPKKVQILNTLVSPGRSPSLKSIDESLSAFLTPTMEWMDAVKSSNQSPELKQLNVDWIAHCLKSLLEPELLNKFGHKSKEKAVKVLLRDIIFMRQLKQLVNGCISLVYGSSSNVIDVSTSLGPGLVARAFSGQVPSTNLANRAPQLLSSVVLPAYRSAVKCALDQIVIHGDSVVTNTDLEESLKDIDQNWHLGQEDAIEWAKAVKNGVPNLFTITSSDLVNNNASNGRQLYRSHLLNLRECTVNIGRLNAEVARSLWASLSWELLYLTNDDDERYSIQAEERLLRNLTVEVADPPLGYPAYSSEAIRHGLEYF